MDTLRRFVRTVWSTDPSVIMPGLPRNVWSNTDFISHNFGLRSHTLYWTPAKQFDPAHPPPHIKALRDALRT